MSGQAQPTSRFTPQNQTTHERLSTHTVGLVGLSDFRKRRAELLEQQEREAREAALAASSGSSTSTSTPDRSLTATPNNAGSDNSAEAEPRKPKKKKPKLARTLVSFGGEDDEEEGGGGDDAGSDVSAARGAGKKDKDKQKDASSSSSSSNSSSSKEGSEARDVAGGGAESGSGEDRDKEKDEDSKPVAKVAVNTSVGVVPRPLTKAALRREAAEREALRKEFLALQAAVKATEIAIPFVFYDGTNIPGGIVRVKKGDHVWLFLDKSRKVGARLGVGAGRSTNARRDWARVSVDDLLLVRGTIIIPHVSCVHPAKHTRVCECVCVMWADNMVSIFYSFYLSITISISSSSTRRSAPATSVCSTTAPKPPSHQLQTLPTPAGQLPAGTRPVSRSLRERRTSRRSPRWSIGGGISATSTSIRPACGRNSIPKRTTRKRSGGIRAATPSSFRSEVKAARGHAEI